MNLPVDADELRAHFDHVDYGYRVLDEEMAPMVVPGHPAPGYGVTVKTRERFSEGRLAWREFFITQRPTDFFFASGDLEAKVSGFEAALAGFRTQFILETFLMDPADPNRPKPPPYTPFPKDEPKPEDTLGPFDKLAIAIANQGKATADVLGKGLLVAGLIGAAWIVHEVRKP